MKSIEWLAGLLEGEGCFSEMISGSSGKYTTPLISLVMTDKDVVESANVLFQQLSGRSIRVNERTLASGKVAYSLFLTGLPAAKVMQAIYPLMGHRRAEKIKLILSLWEPVKYKEAVLFKQQLSEVSPWH